MLDVLFLLRKYQTASLVVLRRDDTFSAKIQENETFVLFLYCHLIDIADKPNKVYFIGSFYDRFLRGAQERQNGLVSVQNIE